MAPALVWIDLEMTGLEIERHVIVQAALAVTDMAATEEPEVHDFVIAQPEAALAAMDDFVRRMHTRSGLLERVRRSGLHVQEAEDRILDLVAARCGPKEGYLAGNSVWVDRTFLRHAMPRLEGYLHYRQVDVSSFKVMAQAWYGERADFKKEEKHVAAGDIAESMAELRFYRELFKRASGPGPG